MVWIRIIFNNRGNVDAIEEYYEVLFLLVMFIMFIMFIVFIYSSIFFGLVIIRFGLDMFFNMYGFLLFI